MALKFSSISLVSQNCFQSSRITRDCGIHQLGFFSIPQCILPPTPSGLIGVFLPTFTFNCFQRFSIGFKSGDWLGHSRTLMRWVLNHSVVCLDVSFESLYFWNVQRLPNPSIMAELQKHLSNISHYFWKLIVTFIAWSFLVPDEEKQPHTIMLPSLCFTVGRVLFLLYAEPGSRQTLLLPNN